MIEPALILPEKLRPLKRAEYDRLVTMGVFEDERVELLYGTLVARSPHDPRHSSPIDALNMRLAPALVGRAIVRVQSSIVAVDESEPDLAVLHLGDYRKVHPDRALLVVEVAVSSAKKDRVVKAPLYARSGFVEYWLVDVEAKRVEVYRGASPDGYRTMTTHTAGDTITLEAFPDVAVAVADVLG